MSLGIVHILRISEKFYDLREVLLDLHLTLHYYSIPFNDKEGIFVTIPLRLVQHDMSTQYGTLRVK